MSNESGINGGEHMSSGHMTIRGSDDNRIGRRDFLKLSGKTFGAMMAAGLFKFPFVTQGAFGSNGNTADKLLIIHTNDMHGRIEEDADSGVMGMAYVSSIVQDFRDNYDNVLVLDAGDTIHGRPIANLLDGRSVIDTMNAVDYDVMTAGNHDFNFGYDRLLELEKELNCTVVSANVIKDGELMFAPYTVKNVGGRKIGVLGLATPATAYTTHPNNVIGVEFGSLRDTTERYVSRMRNDYDLDLLIVLGHIGYGANNPADVELMVTDELVKDVKGIDLFVDGHSHTRIPEGDRHGETLVVQAYEYLKDVGVVEVDFSGGRPEFTARLISAEDAFNTYEPDSHMLELLSQARDDAVRARLGR